MLTHGLVVNELAAQLISEAGRRGWNVGNDLHRNLWLAAVHEIQVLFEIKTTVTRQSICTALGQLLLYSAITPKAALVMVLPAKLPLGLAGILKRWNVQVLYYQRDMVPYPGFKGSKIS